MANKQTAKKASAKRPVKASAKNKKAVKHTVNTKGKGSANSPYSFAMAGIWTILAGILIAIFTYGNAQGVVAGWINDAMFGLFSVTAYLVPIVILAIGIYVFKVKRTNKLALKIGLSLLEIVLLGSLVTLFWQSEYPMISALWGYGIEGTGGGVLGGAIAILLEKLIGRAASVVVILVVFAVILSLILKISFVSVLDSFARGFKGARDEFDEIEDIDFSEQGKGVSERIVRAKKKMNEISEIQAEPVQNIDVYSTGEETAVKDKKKTKKEDKQEDAPVAESIQFDPDVFLEEVAAQLPQTEGVKELLDEQKKKSAENEKPKKASKATDEEKQEVAEEIIESIEKPVIEYKMPPIDLLKKVEAVSSDKRREMYETANKLMQVLKDFGVDAKLLQVTQGPTVTRYEIQPSTGIKLAKITGLAEDIALNLAVPTVLVAAVPGKAAVGIEVPNNTVGTVSAR